MTYKLLIVDDEMPNLRLLERLFAPDFRCLTASSGAAAIQLLEQHDVAILISDQRMPQMTGIELLKKTAMTRPHMVRILLTGYTDVETLVEALNSGLVYQYVTKPWNNNDLKLTVNRARRHYESNKKSHSLELTNERLLTRIKAVAQGIAISLTEMLKAREQDTYLHALSVQKGALAIAAAMDLRAEEIEELSCAALLHDLGDRNPSVKPGSSGSLGTKLAQTQAECEARLLANIPELGNVADIVNAFRENFDGSGLPFGLAANQIPLATRIIRVAHEYDLLIQPTGPEASLSHDEVVRFLARSAKQFDPGVIEILSQLPPEELIKPRYSQVVQNEYRLSRHDSFGPSFVNSVRS